jgi:glycosyltransferase involved in cell wall biosynthesis
MGGSKEFLFDDVNCLITPPGDGSALSEAINRLASDQNLRQRLVHAGLQTARQLSVDTYARVLEDWHRAAAQDFVQGEPPRRTPLEDALAPLRGSAGRERG